MKHTYIHIVNKNNSYRYICPPAHNYSMLQYALTFIQTWKRKNMKGMSSMAQRVNFINT